MKLMNIVRFLPVIATGGSTTTTVSFSDISDILTAVTGQFSVANIVALLAGVLGATVGFVFLWWGVRKGAKAIIRAVTTGKFSL